MAKFINNIVDHRIHIAWYVCITSHYTDTILWLAKKWLYKSLKILLLYKIKYFKLAQRMLLLTLFQLTFVFGQIDNPNVRAQIGFRFWRLDSDIAPQIVLLWDVLNQGSLRIIPTCVLSTIIGILLKEECKMTDSLFSFCNLICSDGEESLHEKRNGELHEQCASCAGKMT